MKTDPRNEGSGSVARGGDRRREDRGSVLLEFIFSFMFFFLVTTVGVMDLGRAIWVYNTMAHATHEGARYAIVRGADSLSPASETDIRDYVRSQAAFLQADSVTVAVTWESDKSPGTTVQIQTTHNFEPLLTSFLVSSIPISSSAKMVITN